MKTAIQEMLQYINKLPKDKAIPLSQIKGKVKSLLEQEQQQIENAYNSGFDDSDNKGLMELSGEIYYKLIFNVLDDE